MQLKVNKTWDLVLLRPSQAWKFLSDSFLVNYSFIICLKNWDAFKLIHIDEINAH